MFYCFVLIVRYMKAEVHFIIYGLNVDVSYLSVASIWLKANVWETIFSNYIQLKIIRYLMRSDTLAKQKNPVKSNRDNFYIPDYLAMIYVLCKDEYNDKYSHRCNHYLDVILSLI